MRTPLGYTLDSTFVSALVESHPQTWDRLRTALRETENVKLNALCYFEVMRGLLYGGMPEKLSILDQISAELGMLYLDDTEILDQASAYWADLKHRGRMLTSEDRLDADVLIAAIAACKGYAVVTDNVSHFDRIPGLEVVNWLRD